MSKVITFSRVFPAYHPRAGEPTGFVEKFHWWFWHGIEHKFASATDMIFELNQHLPKELLEEFVDAMDTESNYEGIEKHHTIRAGQRFKVGETFSPRVWFGKPYNSKQIIIAPDIPVVKVWPFEMNIGLLTDSSKYFLGGYQLYNKGIDKVAKNDGLATEDFKQWFPKPMTGQVICWNHKIQY